MVGRSRALHLLSMGVKIARPLMLNRARGIADVPCMPFVICPRRCIDVVSTLYRRLAASIVLRRRAHGRRHRRFLDVCKLR
jgi:hypothetical protein